MKSRNSPHRWRFFRAGGLDQAKLESAEDYQDLDSLDQKLWVALACPVKGLEFDEKTLEFIDLDKDWRVRAPEILAVVKWTTARLKDAKSLASGGDALPLDQINDQNPGGKIILDSARHLLKNLGKADATSISLADLADPAKIFSNTSLNGDGVITSDSTTDPALQQLIKEIGATQGEEPDRSGRPGITQARADAFYEQLKAFDAWAKEAEAAESTVKPLGDSTMAAVDAVRAVRAKVNDYFARSRLAAFDPRALAAVNRKEEEYFAIAATDLDISAEEVAGFPLARISPGRALPLREDLNPAWASAIARLQEAAGGPLLGTHLTELTEQQWSALQAKLAPVEQWLDKKPKTAVESLGLPRIREILSSPLQPEVGKLIAADMALEPEFKAMTDVEKLIRMHRDLHKLLINFINFAEFYAPDRLAVFQAGILYLDARACHLCVRVADPAKHAALAGMAKIYLAYCDCTRATGEKMTIAAAFTDGDSENLMVGRNGVFYDRKGRDWDATITKVIDNPISIRQAFWSPYKKLVRLIEEQVAKRAAAAEADTEAKLSAAATATANVDKTKPAPTPRKIDVGTVAALGVAVGAIGTAIATISAKLLGLIGLPFWQVVLAVIVLLMIVSGPSVLIAWLKLRQRNLGPILDANGWAVNGRVKVPVSLGRSLTEVARLPAGTLPAAEDKFAEPPSQWPKLLLFVVAVGFLYSLLNDYGFIYKWSNGKWGQNLATRRSLMDEFKPAATTTTNAPPAQPAAQ